MVKHLIPTKNAIKNFNISNGTYHNYKILVINKCNASYFLWCIKQYPHQLLSKEIVQIKKYMKNESFKHWYKSFIYFVALRNKKISFCLTTCYKYCKLLGYDDYRHLQPEKTYSSLTSYKPNEIWCADVTILKTLDDKKYYIHFLMDHYSKKTLGYCVEDNSRPRTTRNLLEKSLSKT